MPCPSRRGEKWRRLYSTITRWPPSKGCALPYEPEQPEVAARSSRPGRRKRFIFF